MRRIPVSLIIVALLGGCAGANPQPSLPQSQESNTVNVAFSIAIPAKSTSAKGRPAYVSTATQSATVTVTPSGGTASTPAIVNCNTTALSCSGTIAAPVGNDSFAVNLYSGTNGGGSLLSTGNTTQTIVADQTNNVNVTFNGVVAALTIALNPTLPYATAATSGVTVDALDASGNTIVGPGTYVNPSGAPLTITLNDSDTSGATRLSVTSITQPTSGITISYNGSPLSALTITASAPGLTSASEVVFRSQTFGYSGGVQTFSVPAGVMFVTFTAVGGAGGNSSCGLGGGGASVTATIPVATAQETLTVTVGASGFDGGFNGGGGGIIGGGGASDVREGGTALSNRVIVAGGGGGVASCPLLPNNQYGGNGGALAGNGGNGLAVGSASGGFGGTQAAGGLGGVGNAGTGGNGALGIGGSSFLGFGSGGGGYYGGGGGGEDAATDVGGGGGGSSFVEGTATHTSSSAGANVFYDGSITISW